MHCTPFIRPAHARALAALALGLCAAPAALAQAETLEGQLERGDRHSVLWYASPESGDLVGQVFANDSQAGRMILARCLPGLACVAEGARTAEPGEDLIDALAFQNQPSGWWHIQHVQGAYMQSGLPMQAQELETRFGPLTINDDAMLLLDGKPVLAPAAPVASPPPQAAPAPQPAKAPEPAPPPTLGERIAHWWDALWGQLRRTLLALLGREPAEARAAPAPSPTPAPAAPHAAPPPPPFTGTAEAVQGNSALHIVAHVELQDTDLVLLQDTGGTACPALYRFALLRREGIRVTPEFGSCSDLATFTLQDAADGTEEPQLAMPGFLGPFEPEEAQQRAAMRLHRFVLRQGQVQALEP